ncbi:hypothetical protein SETIT_1G131800v2 [Setaria italica]|uniref:PUM-HD domain-containing protein n=1 Tax=Setaria italica TaxID=4555 RepID=K3Z142_SETIT|nr:hypothetical protein SETIT_1G131800v2 [Setaria italica]
MLYEEIMPIFHTVAVDVFANHALQKLLEHGPHYYQREFTNRLIGHVLALSLHMYGCWVIQKAFEVGELDQKVQMAKYSEVCS